MRQRTSPKTLQQQQQRKEKRERQSLCAPNALAGDGSGQESTIYIGGFITTSGVLQIVVGFAVSSVLFSGALLFCGALLVVVGIALLHCSNGKAKQQRLSLASVVHRLLALRRSALDYSLTLSIAPRDERCQTQSKVPRIAAAAPLTVVSQKVETATMASKPENLQLGQKNETTALASSASIATRDVLPRIRLDGLETTEELYTWEKPRAKSEPKRVRRGRPLLPLKAQLTQLQPVQETERAAPKQKAKQDNVTSSALTTSVKAVHVRTGSKKMQPVKQKASPCEAAPRSAAVESKIGPLLVPLDAKAAAVLPKSKPKKAVSPAVPVPVKTATCAVASLTDLPKRKFSAEPAHSKPAVQQVVVTRKVLLYVKPQAEPVLKNKKRAVEQGTKGVQEIGPDQELAETVFSPEEVSPSSQPTVPHTSALLSTTGVMEPNFLQDIELDPISKPEKKLASLSSQRFKSEGNAELRLMLDELDAMRLELDSAMARCTSLLDGGKEAKELH
ncbi:unnamed protein product [Hyaloperonospora brassicae]|uniref:Uncharacterized protein n=1 Tax=Hyaloperonospora brassicae TaxID=162125 RepID=A0AAV0TTI0_HYABA|nr:unnamed protein product [Hyaloperonospora brassicae]